MSTDLYLICRTHNEISSEVGNGSYNSTLADVRSDIAKRKDIRDIWKPAQEAFELQWDEVHWIPTRRECLRFVIEHADCDIEIKDEYGKYYDISTEPEECFAKIVIWHPLALGCMRDQADGHVDHIHENPDENGVKYKITWRASKPKEKNG